MLISREVLLQRENPLVVLESYKINHLSFNFDESLQELKIKEKEQKTRTNVWGFFDFSNTLEYPHCVKLDTDIREKFLPFIGLQGNFDFAFIRFANKNQVKNSFSGFHVDVHSGIDHEREEKRGKRDIIRVLINPGDRPRKLLIIPKTRDEFFLEGKRISNQSYSILDLKDEVPLEVFIPPRKEGLIHVLKFWSSLLPHKAVPDENGHFLISYGMYSYLQENERL